MAPSKHFGLALGYILLSTDPSSFVKGQGVVEDVSFNPLVDEQSERHRILKRNRESKSDKDPAADDDDSTRSKSGKTSKPIATPSIVDQVCVDYCHDYFFKYCTTSNIYVNPDTTENRRLVHTHEEDLDRGSINLSSGIEECEQTCMAFPRGVNPASYNHNTTEDEFGGVFNSNLGGDTLWCRQRHMSLISNNQQKHAAFHCSHASNPSMGICRDSLVNGFTPYELLRDGQPSRHHYGYCDLAGEGTIADCTNQVDINDDNLDKVLMMMPATVEVIFLSGISGITVLPANIFKVNLANPDILQAIYLNDCALVTIDESALNGLPELKIFNADANAAFATLPENMFSENPKLLQFSMFNTNITGIPVGFFQNTLDIERIIVYGTPISAFDDGVFGNLSKLKMLSFVNCAITDDGIPDSLFDDLESLQFFDFFSDPPSDHNTLTIFKARWFKSPSKMGPNIIRLAMWGNPIETIEDGAFDNLDSLEVAFFHDTKMDFLEASLFEGKDHLVHVTVNVFEE